MGLSGRCLVDWHHGEHVTRLHPTHISSLTFSQALELLEGRNLFEPIDRVNKQYVLPVAIAQYLSVLGPPLWMIQESENPLIPTFFDREGKFYTRHVAAFEISDSV